MDSEAEVGRTIWFKVEVVNIKRDVRCEMVAPLETKLAFYEKVRVVCRELVSFSEYSNAENLYSRCAQTLRSIPKTKLEELTEEENRTRNTALTTLFTNLAYCLIKKDQFAKAIRATHNAIESDSSNFKAYLRQGQAFKEMNEFEKSTESFKKAISLNP